MSGLGGTLTIETAEYRPCLVYEDREALFHRWVEADKVIFRIDRTFKEGSLKELLNRITTMYKEHNAVYSPYVQIEKVKSFYGIVENRDGSIEKVDPENIKFLDTYVNFKVNGGN